MLICLFIRKLKQFSAKFTEKFICFYICAILVSGHLNLLFIMFDCLKIYCFTIYMSIIFFSEKHFKTWDVPPALSDILFAFSQLLRLQRSILTLKALRPLYAYISLHLEMFLKNILFGVCLLFLTLVTFVGSQ